MPRPLDIAPVNENGKPYLTVTPDAPFQSGRIPPAWAARAVSDHPVGVHIQQCRLSQLNIAGPLSTPMKCSTCPRSRLPSAKTRSTRCGRSRKLRQGRRPRSAGCCGSSACRYRRNRPPAITIGAPGPCLPDFPRSRLQARRMCAGRTEKSPCSQLFYAAAKKKNHKVSGSLKLQPTSQNGPWAVPKSSESSYTKLSPSRSSKGRYPCAASRPRCADPCPPFF